MCSAWPHVPTLSFQPQTAFLPKMIPPRISAMTGGQKQSVNGTLMEKKKHQLGKQIKRATSIRQRHLFKMSHDGPHSF